MVAWDTALHGYTQYTATGTSVDHPSAFAILKYLFSWRGEGSRSQFLFLKVMPPKLIRCRLQLQVIEVVSSSSSPVIPKVGDVITGKILRVQQNAANCRIVCVESRALDVDFKGVIR